MTQYQVIGACAHVRTMTPSGRMTRLLSKGALLPDDAPEEQIRHLLSVRLIAPVGSGGPSLPGAAVPAASGYVTADVQLSPPDQAEEVAAPETSGTPADDPDRVAAREKLPADGSAPDGRASKAVLVEYLVSKGYDYDALTGQDKAELLALAKQVG